MFKEKFKERKKSYYFDWWKNKKTPQQIPKYYSLNTKNIVEINRKT